MVYVKFASIHTCFRVEEGLDEQLHDEEVYSSPIQSWIKRACKKDCFLWLGVEDIDDFPHACDLMHYSNPLSMKMIVCIQLVIDFLLSWFIIKDKGRSPNMDDLLR